MFFVGCVVVSLVILLCCVSKFCFVLCLLGVCYFCVLGLLCFSVDLSRSLHCFVELCCLCWFTSFYHCLFPWFVDSFVFCLFCCLLFGPLPPVVVLGLCVCVCVCTLLFGVEWVVSWCVLALVVVMTTTNC